MRDQQQKKHLANIRKNSLGHINFNNIGLAHSQIQAAGPNHAITAKEYTQKAIKPAAIAQAAGFFIPSA